MRCENKVEKEQAHNIVPHPVQRYLGKNLHQRMCYVSAADPWMAICSRQMGYYLFLCKLLVRHCNRVQLPGTSVHPRSQEN